MRALVTASASRAWASAPSRSCDLGRAVVVLCGCRWRGGCRKDVVACEDHLDAVVGVAGLDLAHGAGEDEVAVVDEADGVAELFDLVHAMGGEEDGAALLAKVDESVHAAGVALTGSRPLKGSSMMMSSGSCSRVAMNWIFCCMPLESSSVFLGMASVICRRLAPVRGRACWRRRRLRPWSWPRKTSWSRTFIFL